MAPEYNNDTNKVDITADVPIIKVKKMIDSYLLSEEMKRTVKEDLHKILLND